MKLIVGLGNPGKEFEKTVHNVGFLAIDKIQKIFNSEFLYEQKDLIVLKGKWKEEEILLLKPQTFMNESGRAVLSLKRKFGLQIEDILIIQDDITILPGKIRFRKMSSSGGHNGIKDIINQLGTNDFARIKIGVGNDKNVPLDRWVVKKLADDKWSEIFNAEAGIFEMILKWIKKEI